MQDKFRAILHSKRAQVYYLEHCRIIVRGGVVEYVTTEDNREAYWNIPIANTTFLLLGNGTSITQAAMRLLAQAAVPVGFCGGGGTPLDAAVDPFWVTPQSECQTTQHLQGWMTLWMDEARRLKAAKLLQTRRVSFTEKWWGSSHFQSQGFSPDSLDNVAENFENGIAQSKSPEQLLGHEGAWTKTLYALAARTTKYGDFQRDTDSMDLANQFLNHGNYLAYGCGAVVVWALGLHPLLAVLHGKTRKGGLVFDFADIIKDGIILPQAFISAAKGESRREFRGACLNLLMGLGGLQTIFDTAMEMSKCE